MDNEKIGQSVEGVSAVVKDSDNISVKFTERQVFFVKVIEEDPRPDYGPDVTEYLRFSSTSWYEWMGESIEPVYDCKELEDTFQRWQQSMRSET